MEGRSQESLCHPLDRSDDDVDYMVEVREPYAVMEKLSTEELKDLKNDIDQHLSMDFDHVDYWNAVKIVCDDETQRALLREQSTGNTPKQTILNEGVQDEIKQEIEEMFSNKNSLELKEMEVDIQDTIEKASLGDDSIDVEFFESMLRHLRVFKARAMLREIHAKVLQHRLEQLQQQPTPDPSHLSKPVKNTSLQNNNIQQDVDTLDTLTEDQMLSSVQFDYEDGDEDFDDLITMPDPKDMTVYKQNDKYRPRKPKYFNRVHTGFEWNKHNRTHYDADNPPPKVIQGYKFNIFYPDLLDKTQTPTYYIDAGETLDTCYVRFHAGPPYEDIAFKIVNREWEKTSRKGYKCTFERGILHLYFKFKKYKYRR
ncbi:hypothetical protein AKO1_007263 [Acrasis kona]